MGLTRRHVARALRIAAPAALIGATLLFGARSQEQAPPKYQEGAKLEQHAAMLADKNGVYGPADGGGVARVVEASAAIAGQRGRFVLEYAAGPLGIAAGGVLWLQVSPFWGWSTPQTVEPLAPGFTTVRCSDPAVAISATTIAPQCLQVKLGSTPLREGATL